MKVVHIKWKDPAFAQSGWMTKDEFHEWVEKGLAPSDSVGLLAHESDEMIVLLQTVGENQVADAVKISRSAIMELKELGEVDIILET